MVSEEDIEKALHWIAENVEGHARAKARVKGLEHILKVKEAEAFLAAEGKNIEERKAKARASTAYKTSVGQYEDAWFEFQSFDSRKTLEELVIECWRTESANRRGG